MSESERCIVVNGTVAIGVFGEPAEARRWGGVCLNGDEGVQWAIAPLVAPEDFQEAAARPDPSLRLVFDSAQRCTAFTVHLHQLLPVLDVGHFLEVYDYSRAEAVGFVAYLKKPLPPDLLAALLTLTHHTRLPYDPRMG
jgi:hypothetical protein